MTPKEAFREFCWKFHGIKPGKAKQEQRMKQVRARYGGVEANRTSNPWRQRTGLERGITPTLSRCACRFLGAGYNHVRGIGMLDFAATVFSS